MRVIAGTARGRKLSAVPGSKTRPTTDRVKEAIFSMIGPYFDGGMGLDLFAGTGGLGIEALSRGMEKVIFIDQNQKAIHVIRKNLDVANLTAQAEVYRNDASKAIDLLKQRELQFKVIFLDPPYAQKRLVHLVEQLAASTLLHPNGVIVIEHPIDQLLPKHIAGFEVNRMKEYGDIHISLFRYNGKSAII